MNDSEWTKTAERVIRADAAAVLSALDGVDGAFVKAARRIAGCRGKILVTGSGTSGAIAQRAAHLLSVGGTPAFYLPPSDGLHGGLGALQNNDLVLAISKGGSSSELNEFCERAKQLCSGVIAITACPDSALGQLSDQIILMTSSDESDLGSIVATGSSLAAAAVTDALVEVCRSARGYSWDKVLFTHPSGAVGRDADQTLKKLSEIREGNNSA